MAGLAELIEVKHADGVRCPRCWNYHTVIGNPQDVCDRCVVIVTEGIPGMVDGGVITVTEAEEWVRGVRDTITRWRRKI